MQETTSNYAESTAIATISLSDERRVAEITTEILRQKDQVAYSFIQIGKLLGEAKKRLKRERQWLKWLETSVDISARMAQRYIQLAEAFPDATSVTHLGMTKTLTLLSLPEDQREEFIHKPHEINGEQKTIVDMSVRELRYVIRGSTEPAKSDNMTAEEDSKAVDTPKHCSIKFKPIRNPKKSHHDFDNSKTLTMPDGIKKLTTNIESAQTSLDSILTMLEAQKSDHIGHEPIADDLRVLYKKVLKCLDLANLDIPSD